MDAMYDVITDSSGCDSGMFFGHMLLITFRPEADPLTSDQLDRDDKSSVG